MSSRKRGERGDQNAENCDRATQPSPMRQRTDGSEDNADSDRSRSATSQLWQVLHDPSAFLDEDDMVSFQPEAFLATIDDVLYNNKDEVDYTVRFATRSILSSRILDNLMQRLFLSHIGNSDSRREEDNPVDELCLLYRIDSLRIAMSRGKKDYPPFILGLRLIDGIVSNILFTMREPRMDRSIDKLYLIERIVAFILGEINPEEDALDYLCLTKQTVSFIGEIMSEKDAQIDKLHLMWQTGCFINKPTDDNEAYFIPKAFFMGRIAYYLHKGLISKKDDPVYELHLIDQTVSFFLNMKTAEKEGQVDKLCPIKRTLSFIDDIIGEKDDQVDKLCQIKQIVNLFKDINECDMVGLVNELKLMEHIVTLLEMMIKGEKNGQVDKLHLIKHIISFLKDDDLEVDKLEVIHHIVSWTETKLLGHGSSRSVDEAFNGELEARNRDNLLIEVPTQDTVRYTLQGYKGRSKCMQYFTRQEGNEWLCNLCGKDIPLETKVLQRNKDGTTTPFLRHLEKFHIKEYNEIRDEMKQKNKR